MKEKTERGHHSFSITTSDNLKLRGISYPVKISRANVLIIHGLSEHQKRYVNVATAFNKAGISCFTFDLRGHGTSDGKRGHTPSYDILLEDLERVKDNIAASMQDKPLFLFGHSMGGNIVANFCLKNTKDVAGAIISSPWLALTIKPPFLELLLGRLIHKIWPGMIRKTNLDPHFFSHDPQVVKEYLNDPLVHESITPSLFYAMKKAGAYVVENTAAYEIPLLVTHGDDDKITSFKASKVFAEKAGAEFHIWKGMYHEPHNEIDRNSVLEFYINWIKEKLRQI